MNLGEALTTRHVLAGHGDRVACRFLAAGDPPDRPSVEYTYARLTEESDRFAQRALRELGMAPGDTVVVLLGRVPSLYVAVIGTLKAQQVVCPLFTAFGPAPLAERIERSNATVLVTSLSTYESKIAPIRDRLALRHVLLVDAADADALPNGTVALPALTSTTAPPFLVADTHDDTPALLHFTSGTTAQPKGVIHSHAIAAALRDSSQRILGIRPTDTFWCTADPGWVTGISYGIIGPLAVGATLIVDEADFDAERWCRILAEQRVDVWYTAATAIRMLMRAGDSLARSINSVVLRSAFSVGEQLGADEVERSASHLGVPVHDTWWQTETGSIMIATAWNEAVTPGSMGRPVDGVDTSLLTVDDAGVPLLDSEGHVTEVADADSFGMIVLRRGWSSMFRGYLGDETRYAAAFIGDWYLTGDLARRDADGRFWFVARADDVIKTAGHLVGPDEVEQVLERHPHVAKAAVYGVPDRLAGSVIHACIIPDEFPADRELAVDVMAHARRQLGSALAPRRIIVLDHFPTTLSGKTIRHVLRAREMADDDR